LPGLNYHPHPEVVDVLKLALQESTSSSPDPNTGHIDARGPNSRSSNHECYAQNEVVQPNNNADYYICYLPVTEIAARRGHLNQKQPTLLHKQRLV